jgi:hypothetical protein
VVPLVKRERESKGLGIPIFDMLPEFDGELLIFWKSRRKNFKRPIDYAYFIVNS